MSRLRAVVCTPRLPWPLDDGGRVGLWQIAWSLARHADTLLLSMVGPGTGSQASALPRPLAALGVELRTVPHAPPPALLAACRSAFGALPYTLERYWNVAFEAALAESVREWRADVVVLNHLHLAPYARACGGAAVVLREHNVESVWLERWAARQTNPLVALYARHQAQRMRGAEARFCESADRVLAVQPEEADVLRRLAPRARVEVVPVGVDFARFGPRRPADPPVVLLAAAFGWPPNAEGARRFVREGWPALRARVPHARLRLVGKDLPSDLAAEAGRAGAEPVGYVDDMAAEFAAAALLVVPLWVGAGARVKIVEALAAGLPVASTPIGAEGLGLRDGHEARLAAEPAGLAAACAELLGDPAAAAAMGERGRAHAGLNWSLERVAERTAALCAEAVAERRAAGART